MSQSDGTFRFRESPQPADRPNTKRAYDLRQSESFLRRQYELRRLLINKTIAPEDIEREIANARVIAEASEQKAHDHLVSIFNKVQKLYDETNVAIEPTSTADSPLAIECFHFWSIASGFAEEKPRLVMIAAPRGANEDHRKHKHFDVPQHYLTDDSGAYYPNLEQVEKQFSDDTHYLSRCEWPWCFVRYATREPFDISAEDVFVTARFLLQHRPDLSHVTVGNFFAEQGELACRFHNVSFERDKPQVLRLMRVEFTGDMGQIIADAKKPRPKQIVHLPNSEFIHCEYGSRTFEVHEMLVRLGSAIDASGLLENLDAAIATLKRIRVGEPLVDDEEGFRQAIRRNYPYYAAYLFDFYRQATAACDPVAVTEKFTTLLDVLEDAEFCLGDYELGVRGLLGDVANDPSALLEALRQRHDAAVEAIRAAGLSAADESRFIRSIESQFEQASQAHQVQ